MLKQDNLNDGSQMSAEGVDFGFEQSGTRQLSIDGSNSGVPRSVAISAKAREQQQHHHQNSGKKRSYGNNSSKDFPTTAAAASSSNPQLARKVLPSAVDASQSYPSKKTDTWKPLAMLNSNQALLGFMADFLRSRGLVSTLQSLYKEAPEDALIPLECLDTFCQEVNSARHGKAAASTQGVLAEWWQVFWSILQQQLPVAAQPEKPAALPAKPPSSSNGAQTSVPAKKANQNGSVPIQSKRHESQSKSSASASSSASTANSGANAASGPLDMAALNRIERSLLAVNLINKDLSRLLPEERSALSESLRVNSVSVESWTAYLQLCQEYTRAAAQQGSNPLRQQSSTQASAHLASNNQASLAHVPIRPQPAESQGPLDSKQLLLLRQSLHQQYLARSAAAMQGPGSGAVSSIAQYQNAYTASHPGRKLSAEPQNLPSHAIPPSPMMINAPQLPLESPFYSPPRPKQQSQHPHQMSSASLLPLRATMQPAQGPIVNDPFFHLYPTGSFTCMDIGAAGSASEEAGNGSGGNGQSTHGSGSFGTNDQLSDFESILLGPSGIADSSSSNGMAGVSSANTTTSSSGSSSNPARLGTEADGRRMQGISFPAYSSEDMHREDDYNSLMNELLDVS